MSSPVRLTLTPGDHCANVAARVIAAVAAEADLPVDRIADAQAMVAALTREACSAGDDGLIRLDLRGGDGRLEIRLGPVSAASGDELLALTGPAELGPLTALADAAMVETQDGDTVLVAARFAAAA